MLASLVAVSAYGGGYYFGRWPRSGRELTESKSFVIATTEATLLSAKLQAWLEDRWGHSLIVHVVSQEEISQELSTSDVVILPKASIEPIRDHLAEPPMSFSEGSGKSLSAIHPDFLRERTRTIPLLWKLTPLEGGYYRLVTIELGWTTKAERTERLVEWLLSDEFQKIWSQVTQMNPVNRELLEKSDQKEISQLRDIPLDQLRYD